ncbi:hypothetical protein F511_35868 [Dorcoceras hygrometricum]|uniref:Uncharacterized protein n=1 Tax=Dorcoceras hygrometricum TaxID=472368 RepID=A0A2Z7BT80_9LAMI|nr:hypothetical protein F511_35868 [Dorcoceras hygrometricum]
MEEELLKLKISPSFKRRFESAISRSGSEQDLPRYTSLKDIMLSTSPQHATGSNEWGQSFSSNISIRNELVKHAASAYVQSATILINRDQDWVDRLKTASVGFCSCLRIPFEPVFRFLSRVFCLIQS